MTTISIRLPEDVIEDLKLLAPEMGFSGYQPLILYWFSVNKTAGGKSNRDTGWL